MKKLLKAIFSPRKLIIWIVVILLLLTVPELTRPSMSQTEAIATLLCIDKKDDEFIISTNILTPSETKSMNTQVYSSKGKTLGDAINNMTITIGKNLGLAQCEVVGLGEKVCETNIMQALDFLTRTKQVGHNSLLFSFSGDAEEFATCIANLSKDKALKLDNIMNANDKYELTMLSNVEAFYKGYYSDTSTSYMPRISISNSKQDYSIEVGSASSSNSDNSSSNQQKQYLINDGSMLIFKNGKKYITLNKDLTNKANILLNDDQEGILITQNVNDDTFHNATVALKISEKSVKISTNFEGIKPKYTAQVSYSLLIEEISQDKFEADSHLKRNKEFFTPALVESLENTLKDNLNEVVAFSRENQVDLLDAYKYFNAYNNKEFKNYLKTAKEKYLDGIDFEFNIKISSSY